MFNTTRPPVEISSIRPKITPSLLTQSFASIPCSRNPLVAPPNTPIHNQSERPTLTYANSPKKSTNLSQSEPPHSLPPRPAQPSTQTPSSPINIPIPALARLRYKPPMNSTWRGYPSRIHHRDDDVRDFRALESDGWMASQEQRVADSQAEVGVIDPGWGGGRIINRTEQSRQRRAKARQRIVDWIDAVVEEGWSMCGEEEKVNEDAGEEPFYDCSDLLKKTCEKGNGNQEQGKNDEEGGGWLAYTDKYPHIMSKWEQVVKESSRRNGSDGYMVAENWFLNTGYDIEASGVRMTLR